MQTPAVQTTAPVPVAPAVVTGGIKRVLNDWKISKKCHALYYGQIVVVPCPGEQRVVRGKPSWIPSSEDEWYRTSHITKFNRNSADELLSVETASKHIYHMGTKYAGKPIKAEPTQPAVAIPEVKLPEVPPPVQAVAYDIPMSEPASLLDVSGEENQTMEIIIDPNNPGMIEDDKKENETQLVAK
jgi:hypothetical protein